MDVSPLANLPPEVRNEIWHLALISEEPVKLGTQAPLTVTCHQIREESGLLFHAINDFIVHAWYNEGFKSANRINKIDTKRLRLARSINAHCHASLDLNCTSRRRRHCRRLLIDDWTIEMLADAPAAKGLRREQVTWTIVPPSPYAATGGMSGATRPEGSTECVLMRKRAEFMWEHAVQFEEGTFSEE